MTEKANTCDQVKNDLINDQKVLSTTIIELKNEVSSKDQAVSGLKSNLDAEHQAAAGKATDLDGQIAGHKTKLAAAEAALTKITDDHTACNGREKSCTEEKARLSQEVARLNGEINTVEETKASLEQQVTTLTSESSSQVQDL